jgi:hypothetical protein
MTFDDARRSSSKVCSKLYYSLLRNLSFHRRTSLISTNGPSDKDWLRQINMPAQASSYPVRQPQFGHVMPTYRERRASASYQSPGKVLDI